MIGVGKKLRHLRQEFVCKFSHGRRVFRDPYSCWTFGRFFHCFYFSFNFLFLSLHSVSLSTSGLRLRCSSYSYEPRLSSGTFSSGVLCVQQALGRYLANDGEIVGACRL